MTDPSDKVLNRDLINLANQPYRYGFRTNIEGDTIEKGLTEEVVRIISKKKNEPEFLLNFRLKAYEKWKKMKCPKWAQLNFPEIDFQDVIY